MNIAGGLCLKPSIAKTQVIKPVSTPSALGSTTLPKKVLSYEWTINDASIFTKGTNQEISLRSPVFPVFLPLKDSSSKESSWSLLIKKERGNNTVLSLCQGVNKTSFSKKYNQLKVLISECTFSFVNPKTCVKAYSTTSSSVEWQLSEGLQCCIQQSIESEKIAECLFDGSLTIQVNANLLCITDSNETVDHVCMVPLDNIRSEMYSLYKEEVFTDATLKCKGKEFKVHRAVLASQSPVFKTMFENSEIIKIPRITPAVVSDLVAYLYTGTAPNLSTLVGELLSVADEYQLPRLFTMCENELKMKIKVANVVDSLLLADLHRAVHLKKACLNFIHLHSADVHKTSKWEYLKDNLDQHAALFFEAMEYRL